MVELCLKHSFSDRGRLTTHAPELTAGVFRAGLGIRGPILVLGIFLRSIYPVLRVLDPLFQVVIDPVNHCTSKSDVVDAKRACLDDRADDWLVKNDLSSVDVASDLGSEEVALEELRGEGRLGGLSLHSVEGSVVFDHFIHVAAIEQGDTRSGLEREIETEADFQSGLSVKHVKP